MVLVRTVHLGLIAIAVAVVALLATAVAEAKPRAADPPQAEITSGPPKRIVIKPYGTATVTWEFAADQPDATFNCKFTHIQHRPCHSPMTYSGLGRGRYTFTVYAFNRRNNNETTRAREKIRVVKKRHHHR